MAAQGRRYPQRQPPPGPPASAEDTSMTDAAGLPPLNNGGSSGSSSGSGSGIGGGNGKMLRPNPLRYSAMRTGICYDVRMRFHATVDEDDMHPEDPRRIYEIYKALCLAGLIDDPSFAGAVRKDDIMVGIRAREVTRDEALLVHTPEHWLFLYGTKGRSGKALLCCVHSCICTGGEAGGGGGGGDRGGGDGSNRRKGSDSRRARTRTRTRRTMNEERC